MATRYSADGFESKYRQLLVLVVVLVLINQAVVQPYLQWLTTDAPLINLAGRQRMLSQRLAKNALVMERGDALTAGAAINELKETLAAWSTAHARLVETTASGFWSSASRTELEMIRPVMDRMRDAATTLITLASGQQIDQGEFSRCVGVILASEGEYLARMDHIVGRYEAEARNRVETLRYLGWAITALTILSLLAISWWIFRPAIALIRSQIADLRHARDELEVRVSKRTRDLEAARERHRVLLEQLSHVGRTSAVGEMASALAHELKQPLGAITNYAEGCLIAMKADKPDLAGIRNAIERLRDSAMRSGRIIENIRRFVTRHAPEFQPAEPGALVSEVMELLVLEARERGIEVSTEMAPRLPKVFVDSIQIQQVILNLTRNALDALQSSQSLKPQLVISVSAGEGHDVKFEVRDNGEGIDPDQIPFVFDSYFSTKASGMGMGLAICRTIIEAHHGRITVKSQPGIQTTFQFHLPIHESNHE